MAFLLLGIAALAWAGLSLITGKGNYKGCPPGGFDRTTDPFNYWAPTIIILILGICLILIFLGVVPLPLRSRGGVDKIQQCRGGTASTRLTLLPKQSAHPAVLAGMSWVTAAFLRLA
jgi:hypothetical protein